MVISSQDWLDAQVGVLGSVMISPELAAKVLAETSEEDYTGQCLSVYRAIKSLFMAGKPADIVLIREKLGEPYTPVLMQMMEVTPTAANIDYYIAACRERGRLLRIRELGQQMQEAEDLDAASELLEKANKTMVKRTGVRIVTMQDALTSFFERHEGAKDYLPWPIEGLQDKLYAEAGDFIVLGGYPSDGKSALALQMAYHMSSTKRVGFFSFETSDRKLFDRMMASVARIPMDRIKINDLSDKDWEDAAKVSGEISARNLEYIPASGMTVSDIQAISYAQRYDVIFVDYLQLVNGRGKDRFSVVTDISIGLHTMAQSTGIAVIALAQLSRPERKAQDKITPPPTLSSLRESGQIEQDADIVFMLYRPNFNQPTRELMILKNKEGRLGRLMLDFDGQYQTFSRSKADQYRQTHNAIRAAGKAVQQEYKRIPDDTPVPWEQVAM